jgi:hypothetical protein
MASLSFTKIVGIKSGFGLLLWLAFFSEDAAGMI